MLNGLKRKNLQSYNLNKIRKTIKEMVKMLLSLLQAE